MADITLRHFTADDAPQLADNLGQSVVSDWLANVPENYTTQDALAFITATNAVGAGNMAFALCTATAPDIVLGGFGARSAPPEACAALRVKELMTIGYWIAPAHWGKGYASEAVILLLSLIREELNPPHIGALTLVDNKASVRVLEKAGFTRAAQAPMPHRGDMADSYIYVLENA